MGLSDSGLIIAHFESDFTATYQRKSTLTLPTPLSKLCKEHADLVLLC